MTKSLICFLSKVTFLPLWSDFYGNFSESIHEGHCAMATFWEKWKHKFFRETGHKGGEQVPSYDVNAPHFLPEGWPYHQIRREWSQNQHLPTVYILSGQIHNTHVEWPNLKRDKFDLRIRNDFSHFSFWISTQFRQVRYFLLVGAGSKLRFRVDAKLKTGRIRKLLKFATLTSSTSGYIGYLILTFGIV